MDLKSILSLKIKLTVNKFIKIVSCVVNLLTTVTSEENYTP